MKTRVFEWEQLSIQLLHYMQFNVTLTSKGKCHSPPFILALYNFTFACTLQHADIYAQTCESCATHIHFKGFSCMTKILFMFGLLYYQGTDSSSWFKGHSCACFIGPETMPSFSVFLWL